MTPHRILLPIIATMAGLQGCSVFNYEIPPPTYASYSKGNPCMGRIGRCFDATIGSLPVVAIAEKAQYEHIAKTVRKINRNMDDVYWQIGKTIDGVSALDIEVAPNALGASGVGEAAKNPKITIYPLDGQVLKSESRLEESHNVRIEGQSAVTRQKALKQNYLPAGRYVLEIRYLGEHGWDRKRILVTVKN